MTQDLTATDMFCGAGGSTTGATLAGIDVKYAINHWDRAIETHNSNYPNVEHILTDLHITNPKKFKPTDILIASPECTNHTKAKGKKKADQGQLSLWDERPDLVAEAEERSRCTMWTPLDWAEHHNYQAILLENVIDAYSWKPFHAWLQAWKCLDYEFDLLFINSRHMQVPQSRDRMYFVAWKRGNPRPNLTINPLAFCQKCGQDVASVQGWKPGCTWGWYREQYEYCCPHCTRIVEPYYHAAYNIIDWSNLGEPVRGRKKPLCKNTTDRAIKGLQKYTREEYGKVIPYILNNPTIQLPLKSWIMTYYGNGQMVSPLAPLPTVVTRDHHALVTSELLHPTFEDCRFRMLSPGELQMAMAFPEKYILTGNQKEQVMMLGNATTPPVMKLLMERVVQSLA